MFSTVPSGGLQWLVRGAGRRTGLSSDDAGSIRPAALVRLQHFPVQGSKKWAPASIKARLGKGRKAAAYLGLEAHQGPATPYSRCGS